VNSITDFNRLVIELLLVTVISVLFDCFEFQRLPRVIGHSMPPPEKPLTRRSASIVIVDSADV